MTDEALAFHESVALCAVANPPVPVTFTTGLPVVKFVENVTVPDNEPVEEVPNVIVNACEPLTGIVTGYSVETILNPEPAGLALFTVNDVLPVL